MCSYAAKSFIMLVCLFFVMPLQPLEMSCWLCSFFMMYICQLKKIDMYLFTSLKAFLQNSKQIKEDKQASKWQRNIISKTKPTVSQKSGVLLCSLQEFVSRAEMLRYCKSGLIPTSHIHLHDTENIHIACNIFKVQLQGSHSVNSVISVYVMIGYIPCLTTKPCKCLQGMAHCLCVISVYYR